jgi:predicted murein hydrolase (TIGR00659 family)
MFQGPAFWLATTLSIFAGSAAINRRCDKSPLLNPTLMTIAGVSVVLTLTGTSYQQYFESVAILHFLLGTAVVALALPLYYNLKRLEGRYLPMAVALAAGSVTSILVGIAVAIIAGGSSFTILSLAPKSATAAVSMEISRLVGGTPAVTGVFTILTGIAGAVFGPYVLDLAEVRTHEARGFAMGVVSHGIATARAFNESEIAGSFAGLGMVLNAVLTSLLVPVVLKVFPIAP